jgi:hypothetical protein
MSTPIITPNTVGNKDNHIDAQEWDNWVQKLEAAKQLTPDTLVNYYGQEIKWKDLQKMKGTIVDPATPKDPTGTDAKAIEQQAKVADHLHTVLEKITDKINSLQTQLNSDAVKKNATLKADVQKQIDALKARKAELTDKQRQNLNKFVSMHSGKSVKTGKAAWWSMVSRSAPKGVPGEAAAKSNGKGGTSATLTSGKAATVNPSQQQSGSAKSSANGGKATTTSGSGSTSGSWGSSILNGPKFSSTAYANSLYMEDSIMSSWDNISSSQNRGKELMQLLFYYMRMAMSGDLTAMYNMMKAVLYIISKDKALQQVNMANKLIELQDASRKATDKLLNFNSDQNDPNSQMEFTKLLQSVKSDSDSIATSQKLIAQMMEEMAQIVETLTNVTKGALDASGRVLRTVSRFT